MHELRRLRNSVPHAAAEAWDATPHVLHRDYETRGSCVLRTVGAHHYAADPHTEVLCCAYALDDGPVQLWVPGDPIPPEFAEAARNPSYFVAAHNDTFESVVERCVLAPRFGWPLIPIEQHRCTMAMALALGLPARLDKLADALELENRKDKSGERLMHQMSKPRRQHKDEPADGIYWFDDPDRLDRLYSYCRQDVETEREAYGRLLSLSAFEQQLWQLSCPNQRSRLSRRPELRRSGTPDRPGSRARDRR